VARRRSCFCCGQPQWGSGQFCNSCGKPLDAPDLELLSGETVAREGADVVLSSGSNKGRSAIAIVGVLAVLGSVATFSGKGTTKATTTTVSPTTTTPPAPTATVPGTTTTSTDVTDVTAVIEITVPLKRVLTTPIIAEKTGLKLLLMGVQFGPYTRGNAIVDLDSGTVTPVVSEFSGFAGQAISNVEPLATGLLVIDSAGTAAVWEPDGTTRPFDARLPGGSARVGHDLVWSRDDDGTTELGKLVAHDLHHGHEVVSITMPQSAGLMGVDSNDHAIVSEIGSGTYSFDPATKLFTRLSRNMTIVAQADRRIERSCDDYLVCSTVMVSGDQVTLLPDLNFFGGPFFLSPDGRYTLQSVYSNSSNSGQIVQIVDLTTGTRQPLKSGSSRIESFAWSPDSQWLFGIADHELVAWRAGSAETRHLTFDGDPILAAAVGVFPTG
jgi:hypothetical protein